MDPRKNTATLFLLDHFCGTAIAYSIGIHHRNAMETDMDSTANLLAALRRNKKLSRLDDNAP